MPLVITSRHRPHDLVAWMQAESQDALWSRLPEMQTLEARACEDIRRFAGAGCCYAGWSGGKDSTVLAHLLVLAGVSIPLVRVRCEPVENPEVDLVRDRLLKAHPSLEYHEVTVWCRQGEDGVWHATGTLERGFREVNRRFGRRHISGVRAAESGARKIRMRVWGVESPNTLAPIGWWSGEQVFAYLYRHRLPVHPAYAYSLAGAWPRNRLRVAFLGLRHGTEFGRREWELTYYRQELEALGEADVIT